MTRSRGELNTPCPRAIADTARRGVAREPQAGRGTPWLSAGSCASDGEGSQRWLALNQIPGDAAPGILPSGPVTGVDVPWHRVEIRRQQVARVSTSSSPCTFAEGLLEGEGLR